MTRKKEFGDFQTPGALAERVIEFIDKELGAPKHVVEPTSGMGSFLEAAWSTWNGSTRYRGYEINEEYVRASRERLAHTGIEIQQQDFFSADWPKILDVKSSERLLVVGNPPWVTNSELGSLGSANLPKKANFQGLRGFDAMTGKSNFDIAEWIIIKLLDSMPSNGMLAMLCKSVTARKVLAHYWRSRGCGAEASLHPFDAQAYFGVSVDACLFVSSAGFNRTTKASIYKGLSLGEKVGEFGLVDGLMVSDIEAYRTFSDIDGGSPYIWRSGIKHDAAKIMEFRIEGKSLINGFGSTVDIERDFVYPLLKSSDIGNGRVTPRKAVLVTQRHPGDSTDVIQEAAPRCWRYLEENSATLDKRRSSIYTGRQRFTVFGIGDYSFAPWKVAISGLYKSFRFVVLGPMDGRPIMLDDTCYFIPCKSRGEAELLCELFNSRFCRSFISSLIFEGAKRPITTEILRRISIAALAGKMGREGDLNALFRYRKITAGDDNEQMDFVMET